MTLQAEIERDTFTVREKCDVLITLQYSEKLQPGDTVQCQFPNCWLIVNGASFTRELQGEFPEKAHHVSVEAPGSEAEFELEIKPSNLHFQKGTARHGRLVSARLKSGEVEPGRPIRISYRNTFAPYIANTEQVFLRVNGVAPVRPATLHVAPAEAVGMKIICPSSAKPGQAFEVLVVSLDADENCSCTRYEGLELTLDGVGKIADDLSFTGSIRVPAVIADEGKYRFRVNDICSNVVSVSRNATGPYWGDIHIHSKLSHDAQGNDPYGYARDVAGLDFAGIADHVESLGAAGYEQLAEWARAANKPGEFVTIPADERNPETWTGHHNIYFRDEATLLAHAVKYSTDAEGRTEVNRKSFEGVSTHNAMLIPHHTGIEWRSLEPGATGSAVDLDAVDDAGMRPVMEIYSHHGQSELYSPQHLLAYEINRMRNPERRANSSVPGPYYAQDYWMAGRRLGVIASSDDHSGRGGRMRRGIAGVRAGELTRNAVFDAIGRRRCYGTTGERILLEFLIDGKPMGSEIRKARGEKLKIELGVWGTDLLSRVDVLRFRFGEDSHFLPIVSDAPRPESMDHSVEVEDELTRPCVYYARVVQEPLEWPAMAWTSPIWVDPE